jgi:predicted helicase
MYAQTIAYGLLSARITDPSKKTVDDFTSHMRTSPFLRELMETFLKIGGRKGKAGGPGIDFDELGVGDVIQLLDNVNIEAVLRDFGDKNRQEDPVMHFFEGFLQAYDKKIRKDRGVFYTPQPVVSYIVRSVHELLQTEFGLVDGLADTATWGEMLKKHPEMKLPPLTDELGEKRTISPTEPFVQILDPATGTATFLIEVIEVIHQTLTAKWKQQRLNETQQLAAWNDYVPKHLLPRLHAFELMMAPYAIAHMKVGLKLAETGYRFATEERARIYLTNALEPYQKQLNLPELDALAHEAAAVNEIKRRARFTVVIGNPPYAQMSANLSESVINLISPFRYINNERIVEKSALSLERNLNDDYIKFLRIAELKLESSVGVIGYVTNNSYVDAITLRGVRWNLLQSFPSIRLLNLHGDSDKKDVSSDGTVDQNVFEIKKGVAITLLLRTAKNSKLFDNNDESLGISELRGTSDSKYKWLASHAVSTTDWMPVNPTKPNYLFVAQEAHSAHEYSSAISMSSLMPEGATGFTSGYDDLLTDFTPSELVVKIRKFADQSSSEVATNFNISGVFAAKVFKQRALFGNVHNIEKQVEPFLFAPFDIRFAYYRPEMVMTASYRVGRNLLEGKNVALMLMRQVSIASGFCHAFVTRYLPNNRAFYSTKGKVAYFPVLLLPERRGLELENGVSRFNFDQAISKKLQARIAKHPETLSADSQLHYCYAILYSPTYRLRYDTLLRSDYPRIPLTNSVELGNALIQLGEQLVALHLLESLTIDQSITEFIGKRHAEVEKISWSRDTVWVDKAQTTGFRGVRDAVWNFHIGGYQICMKWLKDRKGRTLTTHDITHYQKIVVAVSETIRLMMEIDAVIEQHGGWPGAFKSTTE